MQRLPHSLCGRPMTAPVNYTIERRIESGPGYHAWIVLEDGFCCAKSCAEAFEAWLKYFPIEMLRTNPPFDRDTSELFDTNSEGDVGERLLACK